MNQGNGRRGKRQIETAERFDSYTQWQHQHPGMPELPNDALPKRKTRARRSLTPHERIAVLMEYSKGSQPSTLADDLHWKHYDGFPQAQSVCNFAKSVCGWTNEELADYLCGRKRVGVKKRTLSHQLLAALERIAGDDSSLPEDYRWRHWLAEEIQFWIVVGCLPPRVCWKVFAPELEPPDENSEVFDAPEAWRELLKSWNEWQCAKNMGLARREKAKLEAFVQLSSQEGYEWICELCKKAKVDSPQKSPGHVGRRTVDLTTITDTLKKDGFVWRKIHRRSIVFGHWVPIDSLPKWDSGKGRRKKS